MSFDVQKNWLYQVRGRNIHLFQMVDSGNIDTLGDYKIRLPDDYKGKSLIYPSEAITGGLRFDGTCFIETFVNVDPNELDGTANPDLTDQSTPDESHHVNLSRLLTLAVVDYIKAMKYDLNGEIQLKEYYMKEFWKKVGDEQSNRRRTTMVFPSPPFAIK